MKELWVEDTEAEFKRYLAERGSRRANRG